MKPVLSRILPLFSALAVLSTGTASAKECLGISFPDQAQVGGTALTLNGLGLRQATMLKVSVYVAALYVAKTSSDPAAIVASNSPKELILQFVRDVSAGDM